MNRLVVALFGLGSLLAGVASTAASAQAGQVYRDVTYATVDGRALGLDIHMPAGVSNPALLVWLHGGMWRVGNKNQVPPVFAQNGFAVASLDFRQSTDDRFPALVHDIKGANRFLRAHAAEYGYRTDRIAIGGTSSGGHLAALVGVTNGSHELEGTVGGNGAQSSEVQAIVTYYGASNLDPQMPINQAYELEGAYEKHGLDVTFDVVHGAAHGGEAFYAPAHLEATLAFLRRTIGR